MKRRIALSICFCISIMSCAVENKVPITPQPTKTSSEIVVTPIPSVIVQETINPSPSITPESPVSIIPSATPTSYLSGWNVSPEVLDFYIFYGKVCDDKNNFLEGVKVVAKFKDPEYKFESYTAADFYRTNNNGVFMTTPDGSYIFRNTKIARDKELGFEVTASKDGYKTVTRNVILRGDRSATEGYKFSFGCNINLEEKEYALIKEQE